MCNSLVFVFALLSLISGGCFASERFAFALRGSPISLTCPETAREEIWDRITWEDVTGRFMAIGPRLRITNVTVRDAGVYFCRRQRFRINALPINAISAIRLVVLFDQSAPRLPPLVPPDMTTRLSTLPTPEPTTTTRKPTIRTRVPTVRTPQPTRRTPTSATQTPQPRRFTEPTRRTSQPTQRAPRPQTSMKTSSSLKPSTSSVRTRPQRPRTTAVPQTRSCAENQVRCPDSWKGEKSIRTCISYSWMCDGENDCGNGWDEGNCTAAGPCQANTFQCGGSSKSTVPIAYRCDKEPDCPGGDDEWNCITPHYLTPTMMHLEAQPNAELRLNCIVSGIPRPVLSWVDDNGKQPAGSRIEEQCSTFENSPALLVNSTLIVRVTAELAQQKIHCRVAERAKGLIPSSFEIYMRRRPVSP